MSRLRLFFTTERKKKILNEFLNFGLDTRCVKLFFFFLHVEKGEKLNDDDNVSNPTNNALLISFLLSSDA